MPGVVCVGFRPAAFVQGQRAIPTYAEVRREDLPDLVDIVREGIDRYGDVVVLYPRWEAEPTRQRLRTLRAALGSGQLVGYASPVAPLAGSVLVALVSALASQMPTGMLVPALPSLEQQLITVTWLSKVSGLSEPAPSVLQHAQSWLPGSAFAVTSWPRPAVKRLVKKDGTIPLPQPVQQVGVAIADSGGNPGWVRDVVIPALHGPVVVPVDPAPQAPRFWGSAHVTEVVVYPLDVDATVAALSRGRTPTRCAWCAREAAAGTCPFCRLPTVGSIGLAARSDEDANPPEQEKLLAGASTTGGAR